MMRILIVEDEPKIREVLIVYFANEGWETDFTPNGHEAVSKFDYGQHDLIILDLMLEGLPGEDVCRLIREKSNVPIIMLTSRARESDMIDGLNLGADDYIVKPFRAKELVARIYALMRRITPPDKQRGQAASTLSFHRGLLMIKSEEKEAFVHGHRAGLTATEYKLLSVLSAEPNKVFSRSDLSYKVQGYRYNGDGRVIDAHVKNLRKKIEPDPMHPVYVVTVVGHGYKFAAVANDADEAT
ncbi:MAG: two-component system response regulator [Paenibacillus sp.]|jgi:DNA-binding response OmpR family regulator|nr:two-component system response regulator [Paenibacillus sp.]